MLVVVAACCAGAAASAQAPGEEIRKRLDELQARIDAQKNELATRRQELDETRRAVLQAARLIDLEAAAPPLAPAAAKRESACVAAAGAARKGLTAKHPLSYFYGDARFAASAATIDALQACAARGDGFSQLLLALDRVGRKDSFGAVSKEWFLDVLLHVAELGEPVGLRAAAHLIGLHLPDIADEPNLFGGARMRELGRLASRYAFRPGLISGIVEDAREARNLVRWCADYQSANTDAFESGDAALLDDVKEGTAPLAAFCSERGIDIYAFSRHPILDAVWVDGLEDFSVISGGQTYTARQVGRAFDGWKKRHRDNTGNVNFPDFILFTDDSGALYVAGFQAYPAKFGIRERFVFQVLRLDVGSLQKYARAMYDTARDLHGGSLSEAYARHRDAAYSAHSAGFTFIREHYTQTDRTWSDVENDFSAFQTGAAPFHEVLARLAPGTRPEADSRRAPKADAPPRKPAGGGLY